MDWQLYDFIESMKEGADERKTVILECVQEAMLVSGRSRGELQQAQFESALDKLKTVKNAAAHAGKFMKTLLAAGLLGTSLTACAGNPGMHVDPLETAEFSILEDQGMTDDQILALGQECLLLITEELDSNQLGNPNPVDTDGWRKAADLFKKIASGELHSKAFAAASADLEKANAANDNVLANKAIEEMEKAKQRSIGALVSPINKLYHQKLAMAPDFQTWMQTIGG